MPDITACVNSSCPKRGECFRYLTIYAKYQSTSYFKPEESGCKYFLEIQPRDRIFSLEEADHRFLTFEESNA